MSGSCWRPQLDKTPLVRESSGASPRHPLHCSPRRQRRRITTRRADRGPVKDRAKVAGAGGLAAPAGGRAGLSTAVASSITRNCAGEVRDAEDADRKAAGSEAIGDGGGKCASSRIEVGGVHGEPDDVGEGHAGGGRRWPPGCRGPGRVARPCRPDAAAAVGVDRVLSAAEEHPPVALDELGLVEAQRRWTTDRDRSRCVAWSTLSGSSDEANIRGGCLRTVPLVLEMYKLK